MPAYHRTIAIWHKVGLSCERHLTGEETANNSLRCTSRRRLLAEARVVLEGERSASPSPGNSNIRSDPNPRFHPCRTDTTANYGYSDVSQACSCSPALGRDSERRRFQ